MLHCGPDHCGGGQSATNLDRSCRPFCWQGSPGHARSSSTGPCCAARDRFVAKPQYLFWPVALDRHAKAGARVREVVPDRQVLDAAIVPEGNGSFFPAEPHLEVFFGAMCVEHLQDRIAFYAWQPVDAFGEDRVDEQALPAGLGMGSDNGVVAGRLLFPGVVLVVAPAILLLAVMSGCQTFEKGLHPA